MLKLLGIKNSELFKLRLKILAIVIYNNFKKVKKLSF